MNIVWILPAIRKWRKEAFFSTLGKPSKPVDTPAKVVFFFFFFNNFLHTFYHFLQFCLIFELCRLSLPKFVLGNYKMHLQTTLIRCLTCIIYLLNLQMQSTLYLIFHNIMQLDVWWAGSDSNAFRLFRGFNKLKCLQFCDMQGHTSKGEENREGPAWAP